MSINQDDIAEILRYLKASDFAYLRIDTGDVTVVASKTALTCADPLPPSAPAVPAAAIPAVAVPPVAIPAATAAPTPAPPTARAEDPDAGTIPVTSPMVGTFYIAPSADAPPFVEVGQQVTAGEPLALVEAMKMFNAVDATVSGTIERRLVDNSDFVEFGQVLFLIRPSAPGTPAR